MELGSDFLLDTTEQKLAQNVVILIQIQMHFSMEKNYKDEAVFKKKKVRGVYSSITFLNVRYWTKEWDRLHCIFKVV